ncbi:MAG: hypothetical protein A3H98_04260 [Bacteroidetes bacterium RIFCSPLOWO2_02_FULL_36_8]|nr:MAG: hypothetical protein A3H98_04260 [Bacteroidetes bacterium RIFCSPLOWO2_02_FULL_36_8]
MNSYATVYKVTVWLNAFDQNEKTGYNFVTEFAGLVYSELTKGHLILWDTYKRENRLDAAAVSSLEKSSGVSFLHIQNLYIYEYWNVKRSKTKIQPYGFVFTTRGKGDKEVSFGFLEYKDIKKYLNSYMQTNANGPMSISFLQALNVKEYTFNLIQVNNEKITDKSRSDFILQSAFAGKYKPKVEIDARKLILYKIVDDYQPGQKQSTKTLLLSQISRYFKEDPNLIFSYADTFRLNQVLLNNFKINELIVAEILDHNRQYLINEPVSIIFNSGGYYSSPISFEIFKKLPITVNLRDASEILKEKSFDFTLFRINSQEIKPEESSFYISALKTFHWNELTTLVYKMKEQGK